MHERSEVVIESSTAAASDSPETSWDRFEALYRSSKDDLYAYLWTLLRDRAAAEDVTALAFERAYRRRRTFDRHRGEERAWLFGIARNAALDELRRRRRLATLIADPEDSPAARPDNGAEVALRRTAVRTALAGLSARDRELIALKITQSAQLALSTAPSRIDDVAQEVFDVIGRENGVANRSDVTATGGSDGYADFQLSVPSSVLPDTMASLSRLRYAHVSSRTDTTQDVNNAYVAATGRLADARALRTALLKQLANATTQAQIDSLNAQIHDAEASIAGDQAALRSMNRQINTSQITLTLSAAPLPIAHGTSSFTIGKAAHDAGRVLTVAAGVALIALAAVVPVALVGALAWWIAGAVRRRRREQALDTG